MKHTFKLILLLLVLITVVTGCKKQSATSSARVREVVVYAYDSFIAEWGPGPELATLFEAKTGYRLTFIDTGDAVQVLSRALLEKNAPQADVILGIDNNTLVRAKATGIAESYKPNGDDAIPQYLALDSEWTFTPYDWSYFAMIFDSESGITPPASLEDLTKPEYAKKIILMDPRMSTPGLGFVAWTVARFGDAYLEYWKALKPNILTMAPGWSAGYGLFTEGEAPLVISYTTSPPAHIEYDNTDRYKALIFNEGHTMQVEFAGVVKGAPNRTGAQAFIDFLISTEAQQVLPLTQWMYPVNTSVTLPASYSAQNTFLPAGASVGKVLDADSVVVAQAVDEIIRLLAE
jgi:thiamine transport system substrate-binding protein